MTHHPMPPVPQNVVAQITKMMEAGMDQQQVIFQMRAAGLHIVDCIRLTRDLYNIRQGDAKRLVHDSDAWASMRGEYDAFHDMAEAAALQAGFEVVTSSEELQEAS